MCIKYCKKKVTMTKKIAKNIGLIKLKHYIVYSTINNTKL